METTAYQPPVSELLTLGDPAPGRAWRDYLALGLTEEHIPDLARMATDEALNSASPDMPEVWAPLHAWRALGQLRAEAAIEPLLSLLRRVDELHDDWVGEDLPEVFGMIGPAALNPLAEYLAEPSHGLYARIAATGGIGEIGKRHPEARSDCVTSLATHMVGGEEDQLVLNGFIVSALLDLEAREAAPAMERAFADGAIDTTIAGDWEAIQVELGLKEGRRRAFLEARLPLGPEPGIDARLSPPAPAGSTRKEKRKAKTKRKMAKASRKKNRRRSK